jgi:hypothetical protein
MLGCIFWWKFTGFSMVFIASIIRAMTYGPDNGYGKHL